jgi:hypothetical protein
MKNFKLDKKQRTEEGLVSIIAVTIIIIILSLMTAGFAKIMDREFRQSLDRELATQANYAAESGMNDARNYVASGAIADTGGKCLDTNNLNGTQQQYFVDKGSISPNQQGNIQYTCVNINTSPYVLNFGKIPKGQSKIFKVVTSDTLDNLYFSWNNAGAGASTGSTGLPGLGSYPAESYWSAAGNSQATGVLNTTIYPVPPDGSAQTSTLESLARDYFMYPREGSGAPIPTYAFNPNNGIPVDGNCLKANYDKGPGPLKTNHFCNSEITNMAPAGTPPTTKTYTVYLSGDNDINEFYINGTPVNWSNIPLDQWGTPKVGSVTLTSPPQQFAIKATNDLSCGPFCTVWGINPAMAIFSIKDPSTGAVVANSASIAFKGEAQSSNVAPAGWPNAPNTAGWGNAVQQKMTAPPYFGYDWGPTLIADGWPDPSADFIWPPNGIGDANISKNFAYFYAGSAPVPPPPPPAPNAFYYVKLTALYRDLSVSVQGSNIAGDPVKFANAQGVIDVTAKGNDELKRLQGAVSLTSDFNVPSYALQSMDTLCKRIRLPKTGPNNYGTAWYDDTGAASDINYIAPACSGGGISGSNLPGSSP